MIQVEIEMLLLRCYTSAILINADNSYKRTKKKTSIQNKQKITLLLLWLQDFPATSCVIIITHCTLFNV